MASPSSHTTVRSDHEYGGSDPSRGEPSPEPEQRFLPAASGKFIPDARGMEPNTSPDALSPLHFRQLPLSAVRAFGPPALRLGLSVAPPFGLGVPH